MMSTMRASLLGGAAGLPLLFGASVAGLAQQASGVADEDRGERIEEIVTVGTRVSGRTVTDSTVPVDVITLEAIRDNGYTEFGPMLQALAPSFNFSRTQISDGSDIFRPATLRGLGPDQILVLVNGKRRHQRSLLSLTGTVGEGATGTDFNAIPTAAIGRVEILRDGAAAQYGSDAIAGVINVSLKDSVDEFYVSSQVGQAFEGDGESFRITANGGVAVGETGKLNVTAEWRDSAITNRADISPFFGDRRFQIGEPDAEAFLAFYNFTAPINEHVELYSFGGYSDNDATGAGFYRFPTQAERAVPQAFPEGFLPRDVNESEDISAAVGLRGNIAEGWSYDTSVVYGKNDYDLRVRNAPNVSIAADFFANNPDATAAEIAANVGPTEGFSGSLEFEQLTANADLFGEIDDILPDTLYAAVGFEYRDENFRITPGQLESFSCGLSPENRFIPSIVDPAVGATCGFQAFPGFRPEAATRSGRDSYAVYLDLETNPLPWWTLGFATRYEDFSKVGDKITWKVSSRAEVTDQFALRGAISTGFRAPSLQQLSFTTVTTTASSDGLAEVLLAPIGSEFPGFFGIENLDIETSDNFSAGLVWQPRDDLTITIDAFLIQIDDRIVLGNPLRAGDLAALPEAAQFLIDNQIGQANFFSNAVNTETRGIDIVINHDRPFAGGVLNATLAMNLNRTEIQKLNAPQGVDPDLLFPEPSRRFLERGQPRVRVNGTLDYDRGPWHGLVRANYFGKTITSFFSAPGLGFPPGAIDFLGLDPSPTIRPGSAVLVDIEAGFDITPWMRLSVGANNLLDEKPNKLSDNSPLRFISSDPSGEFGNIKFPLRGTAFGQTGGFYYARIDLNF